MCVVLLRGLRLPCPLQHVLFTLCLLEGAPSPASHMFPPAFITPQPPSSCFRTPLPSPTAERPLTAKPAVAAATAKVPGPQNTSAIVRGPCRPVQAQAPVRNKTLGRCRLHPASPLVDARVRTEVGTAAETSSSPLADVGGTCNIYNHCAVIVTSDCLHTMDVWMEVATPVDPPR
jgi:hypothetical protein